METTTLSIVSLPVLPRPFYERDTVAVARDLLGAILVHEPGAGEPPRAGRIVEVEAYVACYRGERDRAAHADRGLTARTRAIFGPAGHAYVYLIYGMYDCLNLTAEPDGTPGCVLIRALAPLLGIDGGERVCAGPGKLTRAMGIDRSHYGADVTGAGPLTVRRDGLRPGRIATAGRIGIHHGGDWPLRFFLAGHPSVSRAT